MASKLSRLKPSFNELDYGQKLDLIMSIRASRRLRKRPLIEAKTKATKATASKMPKKTKLTAAQAAELLAMFSEEIEKDANA
jgi:hypothetical protein